MEPASKIIKALGGADEVATITGAHRTRVYKWMRPKEDGGTGGVIPIPHIRKLIDAAKARGITLTGDDFIPAGAA